MRLHKLLASLRIFPRSYQSKSPKLCRKHPPDLAPQRRKFSIIKSLLVFIPAVISYTRLVSCSVVSCLMERQRVKSNEMRCRAINANKESQLQGLKSKDVTRSYLVFIYSNEHNFTRVVFLLSTF
jgi:hypothetical protein